MNDSSSPLNRSLRLKNYDYSLPGYYFVTTCTRGRERLFGRIEKDKMILNEFGEIVKLTIEGLQKTVPGVDVDEWVVMPDHVHAIIVIISLAAQLIEDRLVSAVLEPRPRDDLQHSVGGIHESRGQVDLELKPFSPAQRRTMLLPKIVGRLKMTSAKRINEMRQTPGIPVWERGFYERVIRNQRQLNAFREYLMENPRCL